MTVIYSDGAVDNLVIFSCLLPSAHTKSRKRFGKFWHEIALYRMYLFQVLKYFGVTRDVNLGINVFPFVRKQETVAGNATNKEEQVKLEL